ncbi:MAG TPA: hypothetical protein VFP97_10485, partial [Chitinophagaceae bacterium]|nr:hypothetical protein [Chitinophagaceae bacterium]
TASILLLFGCQKGDINGAFESQSTGSYLTKVAIGNNIINYSNLAGSKVDVTVKEYGHPVDKIKIFVSKGAATTNTGVWKAVKEVPYSGDNTKLEVTANEIAAALGIPATGLETGATYTLYNQVTSKDGGTWDITNMNSTFYGGPNYNMLMTWQAVVVCPFDPAAWGGIGGTFDARVLEDGWADYSPGDIISGIEITSATQIKFPAIFLTSPARPVVVNINASTGAATVPKQDYGDYPTYGIFNISAQSEGSNNWVFSCANLITLTLTHTAAGSGYGTYVLRLQKI